MCSLHTELGTVLWLNQLHSRFDLVQITCSSFWWLATPVLASPAFSTSSSSRNVSSTLSCRIMIILNTAHLSNKVLSTQQCTTQAHNPVSLCQWYMYTQTSVAVILSVLVYWAKCLNDFLIGREKDMGVICCATWSMSGTAVHSRVL